MGFSGGGSDNNRKKFTGYERDTESGLDYAQARYYSNIQGRFTSPDPFAGSATIGNPQTFNRYVYCGNNPVNTVDPTGMSGGAMFSMNNMDGSDISKSHSGFITEREDAEKDYEQRLQNTRDEIAANNALAVGQDDLARSIVSGNSSLQALDANGNDATNGFVNGAVSSAGDNGQEDSQRRFGHGVRMPIPKELLPLVNLVRKIRKPDFYILTLAGGVQGSVAVTRACTFTVSLGGTTGNVATLMAGWLLQLDRPYDDRVVGFLTGPSFGGDIFWNPWTKVGAGAGGGLIRSPEAPGTRWAVTVGLGLGGGFSGGNGWTWSDLTRRFFP